METQRGEDDAGFWYGKDSGGAAAYAWPHMFGSRGAEFMSGWTSGALRFFMTEFGTRGRVVVIV